MTSLRLPVFDSFQRSSDRQSGAGGDPDGGVAGDDLHVVDPRAVAEALGGSAESFVDLMNERAQELGREKKSLEAVVGTLSGVSAGLAEARELFELARDEDDEEVKKLVLEPGKQDVELHQLLDEDEYLTLRAKAREEGDTGFRADIVAVPASMAEIEHLMDRGEVRAALVVPEHMSEERRAVMKTFGAEIILTPKAGSMEAAIDLARKMEAEGQGKVLDQFCQVG